MDASMSFKLNSNSALARNWLGVSTTNGMFVNLASSLVLPALVVNKWRKKTNTTLSNHLQQMEITLKACLSLWIRPSHNFNRYTLIWPTIIFEINYCQYLQMTWWHTIHYFIQPLVANACEMTTIWQLISQCQLYFPNQCQNYNCKSTSSLEHIST